MALSRSESRHGSRKCLVLVACGLALLTLAISGQVPLVELAAQDASTEPLKPLIKTATSPRDGLTIYFTYWPSQLKQDAPVIVLLHGQNGNRLDWPKTFCDRLQQEGYAVIAVDLRGHGQSKGGSTAVTETKVKEREKPKGSGASIDSEHFKPADYQLMVVSDMEAIKEFIFNEHQDQRLNMNKCAIVGPDMGASVALCFAGDDWLRKPHPDGPAGFQTPRGQDVRALVLLSPQTSVPGLPITNPVRLLKAPDFNVAFLVAAGKKDKFDKGLAKKLYTQLATPDKNKSRVFLQEYNSAARGTELLGKNLKTEDHVLAFLDKFVKQLPSEWVNRESKINRKKP